MRFKGIRVVAFALVVGQVSNADAKVDLLSRSRTFLSPEMTLQIQSDLAFLKNMKGSRSSALSDSVFETDGRFDGEKYLGFILERVDLIVFAECHIKGAVACHGNRITALSMPYFRASRLTRISLLLHEAAHEDLISHAACPDQIADENGKKSTMHVSGVSLAGMEACAEELHDAYVKQVIFLQNVAEHCDSCSIETRNEAEHLAREFRKRIINPEITRLLKQDF